ncbi:Histidine kinase-, DNA gyrase B-, and HSP90-like ATPase [Pseudoxanthomonas sp. CF385]|uniref:ATP-binding protein n=1 Tax=Pseudoxanthomonas sp. CF385 TaxID=1881042 RepID=UPI00088843C4|nr:ATP-binding protein [Pseudoxanthomonas sp. CF385]SDQ55801.1 Histidine kinase-, DNA gyrase B-, and HSP90-like ATPase [Pseudoxanthomonas sp. CF385]
MLVLAPIGRDAVTVADVLQRSGIRAEVCPTITALVERLDDGAGAAFIAEEGLFAEDTERLVQWVAKQAPWSDFPFVLLTSRQDQPQVRDWRQKMMQQLGNVSLLERPVQPITLVSLVQAALRARRRQREVRTLLDEQTHAANKLESLIDERTVQLQQTNAQLRAEIDERAKVEETLRHAQKMDALGKLTGGVAHDFNNLLMVITAGLDVLDRAADPLKRERIVAGMKQAAQRGASLTRQLLSFSRNHASKPEVVDVRGLVTQMSDLLHRSLRGDIEVKLDIAPGIWPVFVDPGELEIALLNLCVNARDAMEQGGTITISAANEGEERASVRGSVRLSVADCGTGMPPEIQAKVFDPFFTTKEVGKGSGLGLAQVYGFARQSGGSVEIASTLGAGSTVTLHLPRAGSASSEGKAAPATVPAAGPGRSGSILLVEDDQDVAAMLLGLLETLGFEVTHATSGVSALGALADGRSVDLVLSDIMMPGGMNGIGLAKEIRAKRPDVPVLLSSGYSDAFRDDAEALGITILAKPYRIQELEAAIEKALSRKADA